MIGHFLIAACVLLAPHLEKDTGRTASIVFVILALLAGLMEVLIAVARVTK